MTKHHKDAAGLLVYTCLIFPHIDNTDLAKVKSLASVNNRIHCFKR